MRAALPPVDRAGARERHPGVPPARAQRRCEPRDLVASPGVVGERNREPHGSITRDRAGRDPRDRRALRPLCRPRPGGRVRRHRDPRRARVPHPRVPVAEDQPAQRWLRRSVARRPDAPRGRDPGSCSRRGRRRAGGRSQAGGRRGEPRRKRSGSRRLRRDRGSSRRGRPRRLREREHRHLGRRDGPTDVLAAPARRGRDRGREEGRARSPGLRGAPDPHARRSRGNPRTGRGRRDHVGAGADRRSRCARDATRVATATSPRATRSRA